MATCSSCGKPIIWAKTESGKAMPLDPDPSASGNLILIGGVVKHVGRQFTGCSKYTSHFATCAQADQHRKKQ
jgi:hypothetical protein